MKNIVIKPFNLEEAKQGKPVCTRSGQPARIVCFDREHSHNFSIVALVKEADGESVLTFDNEGHYTPSSPSDMDLMMAGEKHTGWINIYKDENVFIWSSEREAQEHGRASLKYLATAKIEWEE